MLSAPSSSIGRQRGLSIVELMVGVAVGLLVVAAAAIVMSGQMVENRRLLIEAQIQQDLRAASDIITRDLRRSGYLAEVSVPLGSVIGTAPASLETLESVAATSVLGATPLVAVPNTLQAHFEKLTPGGSCATGEFGRVKFAYVASESGSVRPPFGYMLSSGVLRSQVGGVFQQLTDGNTMNVTSLCIAFSDPESEVLPCPKLCTGDTTTCWPKIQTRTATVTIKAEGRGVNSGIKRQITSTIRVRNDNVILAAPPVVTGGAAQACPA